jgi:hypothetical protein
MAAQFGGGVAPMGGGRAGGVGGYAGGTMPPGGCQRQYRSGAVGAVVGGVGGGAVLGGSGDVAEKEVGGGGGVALIAWPGLACKTQAGTM